ncbi:MAG: aldo/keto reductase, partial [Bacteroidales bacterium]|nr:aldo/keto reductase [Bacteroidales bacterium]
MQYRKDKHGDELSILGYGCMRFSRKGGAIDLEKTEQELLAAYEAGVNYFDTAYIYPGSEAAL